MNINIPKPIFILAPMAGITDLPFRFICKEHKADIFYSEMISAAGLSYNKAKTFQYVNSCWQDRPLIIQLFGNDPAIFAKAAKIIDSLPIVNKNDNSYIGPRRPEGIDINFGCPVKKVLKQGAGCELMKDFSLSFEIIKSVISSTSLPVSLKIRAGAGQANGLEFLEKVADLNWKTVIVHGRTLKQGFSGPIDFDLIGKIKKNFPNKIVIANGGSFLPQDAKETIQKTGADGIAIARGALGNPWIFSQSKEYLKFGKYDRPTLEEIKNTAQRHAGLMEKYKGPSSAIEFRKHLGWYFKGVPGAKQLRNKLCSVNTFKQIRRAIEKI